MSTTPTPTTTQIIRAFDVIQPRQLFTTFQSYFPYDEIGTVWRETNGNDTTVKLCLKDWIPGRYLGKERNGVRRVRLDLLRLYPSSKGLFTQRQLGSG